MVMFALGYSIPELVIVLYKFELTTNPPISSAILLILSTDSDGSGTAIVRGYRNGELIGEYTQGDLAVWETGDAEVFFGIRHGNAETGGPGNLDAHIEEAWVYSGGLSGEELGTITATEPAGKLTTTWGAMKTD